MAVPAAPGSVPDENLYESVAEARGPRGWRWRRLPPDARTQTLEFNERAPPQAAPHPPAAPTARTMPRTRQPPAPARDAGRWLGTVCGVRVDLVGRGLGAPWDRYLSTSCGTIADDAPRPPPPPPPRLQWLVVHAHPPYECRRRALRPAPPPHPAPSCSYHQLPESHREKVASDADEETGWAWAATIPAPAPDPDDSGDSEGAADDRPDDDRPAPAPSPTPDREPSPDSSE